MVWEVHQDKETGHFYVLDHNTRKAHGYFLFEYSAHRFIVDAIADGFRHTGGNEHLLPNEVYQRHIYY